MTQCEVCETTTSPSYYTPDGLGGVTMCARCIKLTVFIDWINNYDYALKALKKAKVQYEIDVAQALKRAAKRKAVIGKEPSSSTSSETAFEQESREEALEQPYQKVLRPGNLTQVQNLK